MYPGQYATRHPDRPAFIMANTGEAVSYREFEARSNRLAHLLRAQGLKRLDHYAVFMENNNRFLESCSAGYRAGLYFTCINSYLTAEELAYIVNNSESKLLITSRAKLSVVAEALKSCPEVRMCLVVAGGNGLAAPFEDFATATAAHPSTPIADPALGSSMLYSSGTTGQPKGILRPLPEQPPSEPLPIFQFLHKLWRYREDMIYLSPAPLYHSAPNAAVSLAIGVGGTVVVMEHFDPEQYLSLIEKYQVTHTQLVPTMFSRMLKLPHELRNKYSRDSLEIAIHAAAPCPVQVKEQMIDWWGPII
ncbi:MAG: AMP-binding protein, partial [Rubrivivax sp.]